MVALTSISQQREILQVIKLTISSKLSFFVT